MHLAVCMRRLQSPADARPLGILHACEPDDIQVLHSPGLSLQYALPLPQNWLQSDTLLARPYYYHVTDCSHLHSDPTPTPAPCLLLSDITD